MPFSRVKSSHVSPISAIFTARNGGCKALGLHDFMENQVSCFQVDMIMEHERIISSFMHIVGLCRFELVPVLLRFALLSMSQCSNSLQDLPPLGVLVAHYVCYTQPTIRLLAQRHDVLLHSHESWIVLRLGIPCVYNMTDLSWISACTNNHIYIVSCPADFEIFVVWSSSHYLIRLRTSKYFEHLGTSARALNTSQGKIMENRFSCHQPTAHRNTNTMPQWDNEKTEHPLGFGWRTCHK